MLVLFNKMKQFFKTYFLDNKKKILQAVLVVVGVIFILLLSGFGYTVFSMSSKWKIIIYGLSFVYFGSLFILRRKTAIFGEMFRKKKIYIPAPLTISIIAILLFTIISFIANKDKALNLNSYIAFILTILLSYFILTTFEAKKILKVFKNTIFILTILAIIFYFFVTVSKTFFSSLYFASEKNYYGTYFFLSNDTLSGLTNTYYFKLRLTSVFWEPSVLATMILGALIAEVYTQKDKLTIIRVIVFVVGIFLTKSTTGYIMLPAILALFLTQKLNNIYLKAAIVFVFLTALALSIVFQNRIVDFLIKYFPDVFSKMNDDKVTASFVTRLESFEKCFEVFLKNPVFGFGGVTARAEYFAISSKLVDAQTSTFGVSLASFGFAGVIYTLSIFVGIIFCKKIDTFAKFILIAFIILISNAQAQGEILIINTLYLLPLALCMLPKKVEARNKNVFTESYNSQKTVMDFITSKTDSGEISRNVIGSVVLRGVAIVVAFFTLPVYLKYFNNNDSTYGVWIAITSILSVVTVFDFGMGNGLKNKLIKNIVNKDDELSKTYISTTYLLTAIIGFAVFAFFSTLIFTLKDQILYKVFFNGQETSEIDLMSFRIGVMIVVLAIGSQFFLKNINYVLQAHQRNAITGIFMVITNACMMLFALIFANVFPIRYKILALALAYLVFLISPLLIANIVLYRKQYKNIAPSLKYIDFRKSRSVVKTSFNFFAVQIGNLFLWSLNEFIILFAFNYQTALVTEYTEYYKLFSLMPIILGTVIQQPLWTAISKAEAESNKKAIKKYIYVLIAATSLCIVFNMLLTAGLPLVFDVWLGKSAPAVETTKLIAFISYSVIYSISLFFIIIMNAFSLFKTQIATAILAVFVKIPLIVIVVLFANWNLSWELVIFVNVLCYLPIFIFSIFEIFKKMKKIPPEAPNEKRA